MVKCGTTFAGLNRLIQKPEYNTLTFTAKNTGLRVQHHKTATAHSAHRECYQAAKSYDLYPHVKIQWLFADKGAGRYSITVYIEASWHREMLWHQ